MYVENLMVNDDHWCWQEKEYLPEEVAKEKGYHEYGTNTFIPDKEAFDYALDRCINGSEEEQKEFKEMLVDWFYRGGNWNREE